MDRVRRIIHYDSAKIQGLSGYQVGVGVLDSGECVIIMSI